MNLARFRTNMRMAASAFLAAALLLNPGLLAAAYNLYAPATNESYLKSIGNISTNGTANADDTVLVKLKNKDGTVVSEFQIALIAPETGFTGALAPPGSGWDPTMNDYTCELVVGGVAKVTNTGIFFTF